MFLLHPRRVIALLLAALLLLLDNNGYLTITHRHLAVAANGIKEIEGPFLTIERHNVTRLTITNVHVPHFLHCKTTIFKLFYQNETDYYYTWFRNDEMLLDSYVERRNDFHIYDNGTLRLPPNEKTSGVYRCKVNANTLAILSESITVEYPVLKRVAAPTNVSAAAGMPVTLNCPIVSVPSPANISWYYGNVSLSKIFQPNRFLVLRNGSVVLRKLTHNDAGKYKCLAHNAYSARTHRQFVLSLTVAAAPAAGQLPDRPYQLLPPLQNATVYIRNGSELQLLCHSQSEGSPLAIEWWYQRHLNVPLTKRSNNSNVLYVRAVSSQQHDGYYTCRCTLTNEEQQYRVIVTVPPEVKRLPSYKSHIASSVTFRCQASGSPKPAISWYHNGMPLNSSFTRYINGDELLIHSFDPNEEGIYQCFARNVAGEQYSTAEVRYDSGGGGEPPHQNPLHNIRCFAHSFNTINVTFDTKAAEYFIVHIVQKNPHRWIAPFAPKKLNYTSYVVITSHLPVYRPFELITRVLFPTSDLHMGNKQQEQTIESSLRSPPVTCCTQGLLLHVVNMGNDSSFVTWSLERLNAKKFFILQFSVNGTQPHPRQMIERPLLGTMQYVNLTQPDVESKLTVIQPLAEQQGDEVLKRAERTDTLYADGLTDELVYSVVVTANVTGVLMQNFTRIKMRALIITAENENLGQDFRFVQWKIIENETSETGSAPFRLTIVESRMVVFHFEESINESCMKACYLQIHFPFIMKEEQKCEMHYITHSQLELRSLKPSEKYRVSFFSCSTSILYGHKEVQTLPDPPGTISNQRIIRHNGLKLNWDPPLQPNGRVHHYNILWTLGNVTHEANVLECSVCSYKFPNISETAKINVTVRVVGETGVGAPIFIDLRTINLDTLDMERSSTNADVYSGIAIGSLLSTVCVCCFVLLFVVQRRRFKARQQGPTHLSTPTDMAFGNLNNPSIPGDSAGGLSATLQHDCHEMQTLIPKSRGFPFTQFLGEHSATSLDYRTTQLPNANGNSTVGQATPGCLMEQSTSSLTQEFDMSQQNLSQMPLCSSTPTRKRSLPPMTTATAVTAEMSSKPFFIPFKSGPPNVVASTAMGSAVVQPIRSSLNEGGVLLPPTSLQLATMTIGSGAATAVGTGGMGRRSGSLSSSSVGSSSSSGCKKPFHHSNFPKHSTSNDGICLLAEEESAATLTPTSENEVVIHDSGGSVVAPASQSHASAASKQNGFSSSQEVAMVHGAANNNNSKQRNGSKTTTQTTNNSYNNTAVNHIVPQNDANATTPLPPAHWSSNAITTKPSDAAPAPEAAPTNATSAKSHKVFGGNATSMALAAKTNPHRRPTVDPNG